MPITREDFDFVETKLMKTFKEAVELYDQKSPHTDVMDAMEYTKNIGMIGLALATIKAERRHRQPVVVK